MTKKPKTETKKESRLATLLKSAFAGPPTQLKEIPTRAGEKRKVGRPASAATVKSGVRRKKNRAQ